MAIKSNLDNNTVSPFTREFRLPSGGLLYRAKHKSFPETVIVEPFSFTVEGIMATNLHFYKKLQMVAERVVTNFPKNFNFAELLTADLIVILTLARGITYGETYRFTSTCPACKTPEKHTIKIPDELPVKNWEYKDTAALMSASVVDLPRIKDRIGLRFLTLNEEQELLTSTNATKKQMSEEAAAEGSFGDIKILRVARRIDTVNGTKPDNVAEAVAYVKRINGPDMVALDEALNAAECGLDFTYEIECAGCAAHYFHSVPLAMDFFRRWA